jgi:hypothetical protein
MGEGATTGKLMPAEVVPRGAGCSQQPTASHEKKVPADDRGPGLGTIMSSIGSQTFADYG